MISKLRRRLIWLFLIFSMLAYTILLLLLMGNAVLKGHDSELDYIGNITDSIVGQFQQGIPLTEQDYSAYATKFQTWVYWSDNLSQQSGPECFSTPSSYLISQMNSGINIKEMEEIVSNTIQNSKISHTTYNLKGLGSDKYYGIRVTFSDHEDNEQHLIVIYPQSSVWSIIQHDCSWYPLIWLVMLVAMYGMSRFLIQKAITPVEASMKSQKDFIAAASHELKAPLAVIQANAESLEQSENDSSKQHKQAVILEECNRMSHLIQSLLSLASSDAGNWKMNIQDTDMDTLFIETWETWLSPCRKKGITLNIKLKEECYPKVPCDKERISQVLGILLDNANSYAPPGTSIELEAIDYNKQFYFSVIDHGPGIPDEEKAKVFERFYRGDPSRSDKNHCGLGLSIAREIIKLHDGNIEILDTPGGGCTFRVSLPIEHKLS